MRNLSSLRFQERQSERLAVGLLHEENVLVCGR
jgi:hypothetical protein